MFEVLIETSEGSNSEREVRLMRDIKGKLFRAAGSGDYDLVAAEVTGLRSLRQMLGALNGGPEGIDGAAAQVLSRVELGQLTDYDSDEAVVAVCGEIANQFGYIRTQAEMALRVAVLLSIVPKYQLPSDMASNALKELEDAVYGRRLGRPTRADFNVVLNHLRSCA